MFESTIKILENFLPLHLTQYSIGQVETIRIDVTDTLYICRVNDDWYVIYETDFPVDIQAEITRIVGEDFEVTSWNPLIDAARKSVQPIVFGSKASRDLISTSRDSFFYNAPRTPLRYALISLRPKFNVQSARNPASYGS